MDDQPDRQVGDIVVSGGQGSSTPEKLLVPIDEYLSLVGRTLTSIQKDHQDSDGVCPACTAIVIARKGTATVPYPCPVMVELGPVYVKAAELAGDTAPLVRECESGCGCRYGTNDPDRLDCACDGPCAMASDEQWYGKDHST